MDARTALILSVEAALFVWCLIYAAILERLHDAYTPRWVFVTVVVGNSWILLALLILAKADIFTWDDWWLTFASNASAGLPIIGWQLLRHDKAAIKRAEKVHPYTESENGLEVADATYERRG